METNRNPKINSNEILTEQEILDIVKENTGIDVDGDIITVNGITYYIHVFNKIVKRV